MSHFDNSLELLDIATINTVCIVIHVESSKENSLLLDVIDNFDLIVAFTAFLAS